MNQFIDSSIVVHAFTENDKKELCRNILKNGGIINTLVLVESFDVIERITKDREYAQKSIRSVQNSNLTIIDVTNKFIFEAFKRSSKYELKAVDLIHYTTALLHNCTEMISYDSHFDGLEIKRVEP